jgi:predicted transcriptional regulator
MAINTLGRSLNGPAIYEMRRELGISQGALARAVGISQSLMSRIESGEQNAKPDVVEAIAQELKLADKRAIYAEVA